MNIEIREIGIAHAEKLSALAIAIYKQYFLYLWNDGGEWYLNRTYHINTITAELADPNNVHYIAYKNEQPLGYLKIRKDGILEGYENSDCLEVDKIYILQEAARAGIGKKLMQVAFDLASTLKKDTVFLKSMDSSTNSIAFYKKLGFKNGGSLTLPFEQMKAEYRGMVILKKEM